MQLVPNNIDSAGVPHVYCDKLKSYGFDTVNLPDHPSTLASTYNADGSIESIPCLLKIRQASSPQSIVIILYAPGRISRVYDLVSGKIVQVMPSAY